MASAHNSMDLAAIKKSMPKKVYEGTDMEDCDPAVLLNAQLFESIAIGAMDDIRTWVKHGAPVDSRNGTTSLSLSLHRGGYNKGLIARVVVLAFALSIRCAWQWSNAID